MLDLTLDIPNAVELPRAKCRDQRREYQAALGLLSMLDVRWELFFSCDFWVGNKAALPEFRSVYYRTKSACLFGSIPARHRICHFSSVEEEQLNRKHEMKNKNEKL